MLIYLLERGQDNYGAMNINNSEAIRGKEFFKY
ncbi:hypothetical protein ES702_04894 [subsurface metagenome]